MSENIFFENFQDGGQVNSAKNIWKPKLNFLPKQGIKHEIWFGGTPPNGIPLERKKNSESIFTENKNISTKCRRKEI